jgi:phage baseplate assembly protein gpV
MFFIRKSARRTNSSRAIARDCHRFGHRLPLSLETLEARTVLSTVSWINPAGGDWSTPSNWSGDSVPNVTQDAIINIAVSGPITIDSASAVHSLTDTTASLNITGSLSLTAGSSVSHNVTISGSGMLASAGNLTVGGALTESGGVLSGAGTVTVDGMLTWTGGTMSGPGTTLANGGLQLGASDGNPYSESLDGRTFQNAGSATSFSTDTFSQNANSIFQNLAHATLEVQSGVTWSGGGTLDNQYHGTVSVDAGTGTASFNGFFTNEGDLDVSSGTLLLGAGGNVTGNVVVDVAATLQFGGTQYVFNSGAV